MKPGVSPQYNPVSGIANERQRGKQQPAQGEEAVTRIGVKRKVVPVPHAKGVYKGSFTGKKRDNKKEINDWKARECGFTQG